MSDHESDALSAAGYLPCSECQIPSFPSDADWLADDLLIAHYSAGCVHQVDVVRLTVPSAMRVDMYCMGVTKSGRRCRIIVAFGEEFCAFHGPGARSARRDRERENS